MTDKKQTASFEKVVGAVKKSSNFSVQLLRSLVVGGIATGVDVGLAMLLIYVCSFGEQVAAACGFLLGLAVNYFLSALWVFEKSKTTSRLGEFLVFALISALGLTIKVGLISLFQALMSGAFFAGWFLAPLNELLRNMAATFLVFFYNFGARKLILYRTPAEGKPGEKTK